MTTATITITAKTWDEERVGEVDPAHAVARATYTTEWAGDATGTSTCWLLISYVTGEPDTATIGGRSGTFVLAVSGAHTGSVARTDVRVVAGSGTGELKGISGSGSYAADEI